MKTLIIGGGIGGYALAIALHQRGLDAVVVEKAPSFKALGHFIALKAEGVRVLDRLGVAEPCAAAALPPTTNLRFLNASGRLLREQDLRIFGTALGGYLMMRRADLSAALHDAAAPHTEIRFGTEVTALDQDGDGVNATFSDGRVERFDVVVGADGVHSRTRQLLFGEAGPVALGGSYIALEVDGAHGLQVGQMNAYLGRGQFVGLFPMTPARVAGIIYHGEPGLRASVRCHADARRFFAREYAVFHPDVRERFASIDDDDFVFVDNIVRIDLPRIHAGRVALLGDAAACPTFASGMGSAFAMLSAEVLASRLAACPPADLPAALADYDQVAQGMAAELKANAGQALAVLLGRNPLLQIVRDEVLHLFPQALLLAQVKRMYALQAS